MTLNRRHRVIVFVTLVLTGSSLLLGAELKQTLGMMFLGLAAAWALGSDAASKSYSRLKTIGHVTYRWVRLPLVMIFSGSVFSLIYALSRGNPVLVVAGMSIVGIATAPLTELPSKKLWLRIPIFLFAGVAFFVPLIGAADFDPFTQQHAEDFGAVAVEGLLILLVGIWWLARGWRLIERGIGAEMPPAVDVPQEVVGGLPIVQYISLFLGLTTLTLWVGLLAWSASSNWVYPLPTDRSSGTNNNLIAQVGFVNLLAWWPYATWRKILRWESNFKPEYLRRHRRVTAVAGMLFTLVVCLAATFGIENGNDRILTDKIAKVGSQLGAVAAKIGAIKQRDLKTTSDYIQAYSEIDSLIPEYDLQIQNAADAFEEGSQLDERRGPINTQFFYKSHGSDVWRKYDEMIDLARKVSALTKQETSSAKDMAALPEKDRAEFWQKNFKPLLVQEDILRQKYNALQAKKQSVKTD